VSAFLDVELARVLETKEVGTVRAARIACQLAHFDGARSLVSSGAGRPGGRGAGASAEEGGGEGALEGASLARDPPPNLIYGSVTAEALKASLVRRGYSDCHVLPGGVLLCCASVVCVRVCISLCLCLFVFLP
jgi:hypothetical protein